MEIKNGKLGQYVIKPTKADKMNDKEYQDLRASEQVLGCLLQSPDLLGDHRLTPDDFPNKFYRLLFQTINNCRSRGTSVFRPSIIEDYIKNYTNCESIYARSNGNEMVKRLMQDAELANFEHNYGLVKKYSVLRALMAYKIDVDEIYSPSDTLRELQGGETGKAVLENIKIEDILDFYREKIANISAEYSTVTDSTITSTKVGSQELKEQVENWKVAPAFGLSYASNYQNTITKGIRKKRFTISSAVSGTGKSRMTVAHLCHTFIPRYWDANKEEFVDNPNGVNNAALYIGTEMELTSEVEPLFLAYISYVDIDHITTGKYEPGEEERIQEAMNILENSQVYLEYMPDYNIARLEEKIRYYVKHKNVSTVFFDYIHITPQLTNEFTQASGGKSAVREDQVLANVSTRLKNLCNELNISIDTWTQVSGDFHTGRRDQGMVRGSKAMIDKADVASIMFRLEQADRAHIQGHVDNYNRKYRPMGTAYYPNLGIAYYKNRGGKYSEITVWIYFEYATMRVHDMFCTERDYELSSIEPSYVYIDEDNNIAHVNDKNKVQITYTRPKFKSLQDDFQNSDTQNQEQDQPVTYTYMENPEEVHEIIQEYNDDPNDAEFNW